MIIIIIIIIIIITIIIIIIMKLSLDFKTNFRRFKLVLKSRLNDNNKILAANTWAVSLLRYNGGIIKWTKDELKRMDRKTQKLMTIHGALHPESDVDRIYIPRGKEAEDCSVVKGASELKKIALDGILTIALSSYFN